MTAGALQPLSGFGLVTLAGFDPWSSWLVVSYGLYALAALCWFPAVRIQLRVRDIAAAAAASDAALPPDYERYMRTWFWLGWPAFLSLLGVFVLMVMRPALW